ncbi:MAG TPA: antitoxin Xre-like helix-turn-helix domain-containing protein [Candidatus Polarisedimenticolaceae bacterium]
MARSRSSNHESDADRYRRFSVGEPRLENPYVAFLGMSGKPDAALVRELSTGLPFTAFARLQDNLAVTATELAIPLGIPVRTLARRRAQGRLTTDESDRLVRVSRVFAATVDLFDGHLDSARQWWKSEIRGLGYVRPLDAVRTEVGTRAVETLIHQLAHGVFP